MTDPVDPELKGDMSGTVVPNKPVTSKKVPGLSPSLTDYDQKLLILMETRVLNVLRKETRDPYAGLPADDVLVRLDERFPAVDFPERMMHRLELEQQQRHSREDRTDELQMYEATTDRIDAAEERELQRSSGRRAERVLYFLVGVGGLFVFTGHEGVGVVILGTSLVGVIGAFLSQRFRRHPK